MGILSRNLILGLGALAILGGCGSGAHSDQAARSKAAASRKAASANDSMVSAVTLNKTTGAVPLEVKFELRDRPEVAQPANIDLIIIPMSAAVDRVSGKVEADEGLDLVDGGQIPATERPTEGVPIRHSIKVQAKRDGIFTFSAVVVVESSGQSTTETFSMPVIAGAGMPDLPAKPGSPTPGGAAPAATAAAGSATARATVIGTKGTPAAAAAVQ